MTCTSRCFNVHIWQWRSLGFLYVGSICVKSDYIISECLREGSLIYVTGGTMKPIGVYDAVHLYTIALATCLKSRGFQRSISNRLPPKGLQWCYLVCSEPAAKVKVTSWNRVFLHNETGLGRFLLVLCNVGFGCWQQNNSNSKPTQKQRWRICCDFLIEKKREWNFERMFQTVIKFLKC